MKNELTMQDLLDMITAGKEAAPWADAVKMNITNARKLGMPAEVLGLELIAMDEGFPDDYILVGGK